MAVLVFYLHHVIWCKAGRLEKTSTMSAALGLSVYCVEWRFHFKIGGWKKINRRDLNNMLHTSFPLLHHILFHSLLLSVCLLSPIIHLIRHKHTHQLILGFTQGRFAYQEQIFVYRCDWKCIHPLIDLFCFCFLSHFFVSDHQIHFYLGQKKSWKCVFQMMDFHLLGQIKYTI